MRVGWLQKRGLSHSWLPHFKLFVSSLHPQDALSKLGLAPIIHQEGGKFVSPEVPILCCSVTQSCLALCNPMNCSTPGFSVLHPLPKLAQIHVHCVGDAIQLSHPLSSSSPPAFNLCQHQGLFQWVGSSYQVAKVLELQLSISTSNEYSGFISFRIDWFDLLAVEEEYYPTPQFKSIHSSSLSLLYGPTVTSIHDYCKKHSFDNKALSWQSNVSVF